MADVGELQLAQKQKRRTCVKSELVDDDCRSIDHASVEKSNVMESGDDRSQTSQPTVNSPAIITHLRAKRTNQNGRFNNTLINNDKSPQSSSKMGTINNLIQREKRCRISEREANELKDVICSMNHMVLILENIRRVSRDYIQYMYEFMDCTLRGDLIHMEQVREEICDVESELKQWERKYHVMSSFNRSSNGTTNNGTDSNEQFTWSTMDGSILNAFFSSATTTTTTASSSSTTANTSSTSYTHHLNDDNDNNGHEPSFEVLFDDNSTIDQMTNESTTFDTDVELIDPNPNVPTSHRTSLKANLSSTIVAQLKVDKQRRIFNPTELCEISMMETHTESMNVCQSDNVSTNRRGRKMVTTTQQQQQLSPPPPLPPPPPQSQSQSKSQSMIVAQAVAAAAMAASRSTFVRSRSSSSSTLNRSMSSNGGGSMVDSTNKQTTTTLVVNGHSKPLFSCDYDGCQYVTNMRQRLAMHKRVHAGELLYTCDVAGCDYQSNYKGNIKIHKKHRHRMEVGSNANTCSSLSVGASVQQKRKRTKTTSYMAANSDDMGPNSKVNHTIVGNGRKRKRKLSRLQQESMMINYEDDDDYILDDDVDGMNMDDILDDDDDDDDNDDGDDDEDIVDDDMDMDNDDIASKHTNILKHMTTSVIVADPNTNKEAVDANSGVNMENGKHGSVSLENVKDESEIVLKNEGDANIEYSQTTSEFEMSLNANNSENDLNSMSTPKRNQQGGGGSGGGGGGDQQDLDNQQMFECTIDGCTYQSKWKQCFTAHQLSHAGVKPYKCDHPGCNYRTNFKGNVNVHKRVHRSNEFRCQNDGCTFTTAWKNSFLIHQRNHCRMMSVDNHTTPASDNHVASYHQLSSSSQSTCHNHRQQQQQQQQNKKKGQIIVGGGNGGNYQFDNSSPSMDSIASHSDQFLSGQSQSSSMESITQNSLTHSPINSNLASSTSRVNLLFNDNIHVGADIIFDGNNGNEQIYEEVIENGNDDEDDDDDGEEVDDDDDDDDEDYDNDEHHFNVNNVDQQNMAFVQHGSVNPNASLANGNFGQKSKQCSSNNSNMFEISRYQELI
ncbi:hypothetical protein BLOT_012672 [Blomia tropicalis]|nr:hypothetical protein BLOT_012672 [Blomia tropicalis]